MCVFSRHKDAFDKKPLQRYYFFPKYTRKFCKIFIFFQIDLKNISIFVVFPVFSH